MFWALRKGVFGVSVSASCPLIYGNFQAEMWNSKRNETWDDSKLIALCKEQTVLFLFEAVVSQYWLCFRDGEVWALPGGLAVGFPIPSQILRCYLSMCLMCLINPRMGEERREVTLLPTKTVGLMPVQNPHHVPMQRHRHRSTECNGLWSN